MLLFRCHYPSAEQYKKQFQISEKAKPYDWTSILKSMNIHKPLIYVQDNNFRTHLYPVYNHNNGIDIFNNVIVTT